MQIDLIKDQIVAYIMIKCSFFMRDKMQFELIRLDDLVFFVHSFGHIFFLHFNFPIPIIYLQILNYMNSHL